MTAEQLLILRLKARPTRVSAGAETVKSVEDASKEGPTVSPLPGGDVVVRIRHRSAREIKVVLPD